MSLPALHNAADIRTITERVSVLIRDYNGGRVEDLAQALADIAALEALHAADTTVFLGSNVSLNNTANWFNGPNTGSIGAAGQKWLILAKATIQDTAGAASVGMRISDGTNLWDGGETSTSGAGVRAPFATAFITTLGAPTTFTLQARDGTSTSGLLLTSGVLTGLPANRATSITPVRLQ